MKNAYAARLQEFGEKYEDFEASELRNLIVGAGERISALCLTEPAVDDVMKRLHISLGLSGFPTDHEGGTSWRDLWNNTSDVELLDLPLAQRLTTLNAYAFFGLSTSTDGTPCTLQDAKELIASVGAALGSAEADLPATADIRKTLLAAQGRLALDAGAGLPVEQLAALVKISMKSMRNALAPSSGSGLETNDGLVTAISALNWLTARGDFKPSIWQESQADEVRNSAVSTVDGQILWIPVASDGTEFLPSNCIRAGKYTVGPRGAEQSFSNYRDALDCLARMRPAAYWRRPNSAGNWGLVTATGFHPRTADELRLLSDSNIPER